MKRIKITSIILTIFLIIFISCSEEWLKPDPLSFYAPENVFIDEAGFESGLVRCRKDILDENHGAQNFINAEHAYSDIACALFQCDFTQNTPSYSFQMPVLRFFTSAYLYIKNTNIIISRIDDIEWAKQSVRNRILAEALWFRAYWYYRLVHTYGDIPWVGEEITGAKLDFFSTTRWAILTKIQEDLEFALEWLPVSPPALGNVSKGAVNHLLAKVYLANCEFDKAIIATSEVISGPYHLMTERFGSTASNTYHNLLWDLHRVENKNHSSNKETIYANIDRADAPPETWSPGTFSMRMYGPQYWGLKDASGGRATDYRTPAGDTLGNGNSYVKPTKYFQYWIWEDQNYNWDETPDMRRADSNWIEMGDSISEITVNRPGSKQFGQPLELYKYGNELQELQSWHSWPYYKTYVPTPNATSNAGGQGDWYIFRLAETYLLRAEAYYWKGQNSLAAEDINKVRARANAPLISASDVTIDYIFDERARELYTEEPRHSEMVRVSFIFGKLSRDGYNLEGITVKNWYHDRVMRVNHYYHPPKMEFYGNTATLLPYNILWPIPQSVITANTLGRINQNIGYEGAELNVPPIENIE